MRICLIGEYSGRLEEGMRNTAFYLDKELSKDNQVLALNVKEIFSRRFFRKIREFNPQIIHYIPGPSAMSFIILKLLSFYSPGAKTILSAPIHPSTLRLPKKIIKVLRPDLVLPQSDESEGVFLDLGLKTEFLSSGVDTKKFAPVSLEVKEKLRDKYNVEKNKFVILHVGSIKEGRGIGILDKIQTGENQVIVIGNESMGIEKETYTKIKKSGCRIWKDYFDNIEEIYALSDCYVFPTPSTNKKNSIETPLSVLEAMSCNLPVVATKFGALERIFKEGDGLSFAENHDDFLKVFNEFKNSNFNIKTREQVLPYSWGDVVKRLEGIYSDLVFNSGGSFR